jgi:hypothetical protein
MPDDMDETARFIEETDRRIEANDQKIMEAVTYQVRFFTELAERVQRATTIADRQVLADELRDHAEQLRRLARKWV